MKIKLVFPENEADYIRHARTETRKSIGEKPAPSEVEPSRFAMYFVAYDERQGNRPAGLAEVAFLDQVYRTFADSVYPASLELDRLCSLEETAGIRTIYLEPEYRQKSASLYLQLVLAGARTVEDLGGRFATATTTVGNHELRRLYLKTGGEPMGTFPIESMAEEDVALYLFRVHKLLRHPLLRRVAPRVNLKIDPEIARNLRARTAWDAGA